MPGLVNIDGSAIADLIGKGIERIWPDKSAQEKQQLANDFALLQGQLEINKIEAASPNWWVAGWRPAVGWVCVLGLLLQFFIFPLIALSAVKIPAVDTGSLITLLLTLLGMGTLRTIEKNQGSEGNRN